jgi:hypothetical protein
MTSNYLLKLANSCTLPEASEHEEYWQIYQGLRGYGEVSLRWQTIALWLGERSHSQCKGQQEAGSFNGGGNAPWLVLLGPSVESPFWILEQRIDNQCCVPYPKLLNGSCRRTFHRFAKIPVSKPSVTTESPNSPSISFLSPQHLLQSHCLSGENWVIKFYQGEGRRKGRRGRFSSINTD